MATNYVAIFAKLTDPTLIQHAGEMECGIAIPISED